MSNLTDITMIVAIVACAGITVATVFIIPWVKSNISKNKLDEMGKWVQYAVKAYEQLAKTGAINKKDKYIYVLKFLEKKGYTINTNELKVLIEAFVHDLPDIITMPEISDNINESDKDNNEEEYVDYDPET